MVVVRQGSTKGGREDRKRRIRVSHGTSTRMTFAFKYIDKGVNVCALLKARL